VGILAKNEENDAVNQEQAGETIALEFSGQAMRLDTWLAGALPDLSRARIQELVKAGQVKVNGRPCKPSLSPKAGDRIEVFIPAPTPVEVRPENIPLEVLYEDSDLIAINKPAGLVTHPAPGHDSGTLVNALLHHCKDLGGIGGELRPGIVHRLDKDTTGVLVVAKNEPAMHALVEQFKNRRVMKEYVALVWGHLSPPKGTIETLLGRSSHDRKKMSARPEHGRPAVTHYETVEIWKDISYLRIHIETGRTHQIRVHMTHLGHPVVGDHQYGRARNIDLPAPADRQMLHARFLRLAHPRTGETLELTAPIPGDMQALIDGLRSGRAKPPAEP
jgi:23S rRNA pseudouridine1911/1915/1917 synthase